MDLLIRGARLLSGDRVDIGVANGLITSITASPSETRDADRPTGARDRTAGPPAEAEDRPPGAGRGGLIEAAGRPPGAEPGRLIEAEGRMAQGRMAAAGLARVSGAD